MPHGLKDFKTRCGCVPFPAGTDQSAVGDPVGQEALMEHGRDALQGSLLRCTLSAGTDQGSTCDPVWQDALTQHSLEELPGSQRQRSRCARPDQAL